MSFMGGKAFTSAITRLRIGFAPALQVGIDQKIHGMKLMTLAAHVHGGRLAGGGDGSQVGIDVILPQPQPGKNMRRHMQRMRRGGSDLGIAARRGQSQFGQLRLVIAVNQVMRHSGMVGLLP